jgi:hypothetical protein
MSNFQLAGPGDVFLGQNVTDLVDPILCNRNITWHFYQDSSYQAISQVDTPGEHRTSEGSPPACRQYAGPLHVRDIGSGCWWRWC